MFKQTTPLGRIGRADEMAKAIQFLASDDAVTRPAPILCAYGGFAQI